MRHVEEKNQTFNDPFSVIWHRPVYQGSAGLNAGIRFMTYTGLPMASFMARTSG